jgi:hypothetical protein
MFRLARGDERRGDVELRDGAVADAVDLPRGSVRDAAALRGWSWSGMNDCTSTMSTSPGDTFASSSARLPASASTSLMSASSGNIRRRTEPRNGSPKPRWMAAIVRGCVDGWSSIPAMRMMPESSRRPLYGSIGIAARLTSGKASLVTTGPSHTPRPRIPMSRRVVIL